MEKNQKKVFFLGPKGSYCQIALNIFKEKILQNVQAEPVSTIKKILDMVDENENYYAVLPVENSIEGIVRETVDNILNSKDSLKILSETVVTIEHCLLSKGDFSSIRKIVSHPQALAQCQRYICEKFNSNVELIASSSTSASAVEASKVGASCASLANELCAKLYDLNVLEKNISENKQNFTRFLLLGHNSLKLPCSRTTFAFSTKNEAGALLKILEIFKNHNLNLIYLESRPSKRVLGEYIFFADIDKGCHVANAALDEISSKCNFFKIFGSYSPI